MQQHQETHPQKGEHGSGCGNLVLVRNQGTASWLQTPLGGTPPSPLQPWHSGAAVSDGAPSFSSRGTCWVLGLMREGQSLCNTTSRASSPPCPRALGVEGPCCMGAVSRQVSWRVQGRVLSTLPGHLESQGSADRPLLVAPPTSTSTSQTLS